MATGRKTRAPSDTPCAHCGLEVGRFPVGEDTVFCCGACRTVHATLQSAGLSETYYRLRDVGAVNAAKPASLSEAQAFDILDDPAFLEAYTRATPGGRSANLHLDGVHCAACVWLVERMPLEVAGVRSARLDLARSRLSLEWDPDDVSLSAVSDWLAGFGYTPQPLTGDGGESGSIAENRLLLRMGVAWALAANVMLIALAFYAGLASGPESGLYQAGRWVSLVLAVPAIFFAGQPFFVRAWSSVRRAARTRSLRALDMDTPIALGLLVGFTDSLISTVSGQGEVWFDSLTLLVAALLTARWLQLRSRRLAGDASERLLSIVPATALLIAPDGSSRKVNAASLDVNQLVRVDAGSVIPVDGVIVEGISRIDNAIITGESRPEEVAVDTRVEAGATNLTRPIVVRVESAGAATRVGQLLNWVRDASGKRAPVVQLADRLSGYFVVAVLGAALAAGLFWWAVDPSDAARNVVALLVVSCPCALGMATPLAMAVAAGRAARAGIFIKSEAALEVLDGADTIVLDKTGTVTAGQPAVLDAAGDPRAIEFAAALEAGLSHPFARAIAGFGRKGDPTVEGISNEPGLGVRGVVDGHEVLVGSPEWVRQSLEDGSPDTGAMALPGGAQSPEKNLPGDLARPYAKMSIALALAEERFVAMDFSPVLIAVDGLPAALLGLGDRVRPEALQVVGLIQATGRSVRMLSGDHPSVVRTVAQEAGIDPDASEARISPEQKRDFVQRLQQEGHRVVMIGDGVNDAAALVQADVGIAVAGGTTASMVAADLFLTRRGLTPVAELISSSRRVMMVIRRNLGLSLAYNVVMASLAFAGVVSPLVAAIAMPISSLAVVVSSIAQATFRSGNAGSGRPLRPSTRLDPASS